MYVRPEIAGLLVQAKIKDAQSRVQSMPELRAASLDRQSGHAVLRFRIRRHTPQAHANAVRSPAQRDGIRVDAPPTRTMYAGADGAAR